jgi:hypothetical protein
VLGLARRRRGTYDVTRLHGVGAPGGRPALGKGKRRDS